MPTDVNDCMFIATQWLLLNHSLHLCILCLNKLLGIEIKALWWKVMSTESSNSHNPTLLIRELWSIHQHFTATVREDNLSCTANIAPARKWQFTPRTMPIASKYYHFCRFVESKAIEIQSLLSPVAYVDGMVIMVPHSRWLQPSLLSFLQSNYCGFWLRQARVPTS